MMAPTLEADLGLAAQRLGGAVHGVVDRRQLALGGGEQILALEPPGAGEIGVAADDEALARIVVGGDAGEVALVEQRELEGAGVEQGADLRGAQRSDPVEPGRLDVLIEAGLGDHTAVTDQHHMSEVEPPLELVDLGRQGGRVAGRAF